MRESERFQDVSRHLQEALLTYFDQGDLGAVHQTLTDLSRTAFIAGRADLAAYLLGAAERFPQHVLYQPSMVELQESVRTSIGETALQSSWNEGMYAVWDDVLAHVAVLATDLAKSETVGLPLPVQGAGLTRRELEVLQLLAEGRSNRAIGEALSISERTVENHVLHILNKLDLDSRTSAATWAVRHNLA